MRGVFCVIGAYTLSNNVVEVIIMIGFGPIAAALVACCVALIALQVGRAMVARRK